MMLPSPFGSLMQMGSISLPQEPKAIVSTPRKHKTKERSAFGLGAPGTSFCPALGRKLKLVLSLYNLNINNCNNCSRSCWKINKHEDIHLCPIEELQLETGTCNVIT